MTVLDWVLEIITAIQSLVNVNVKIQTHMGGSVINAVPDFGLSLTANDVNVTDTQIHVIYAQELVSTVGIPLSVTTANNALTVTTEIHELLMISLVDHVHAQDQSVATIPMPIHVP